MITWVLETLGQNKESSSKVFKEVMTKKFPFKYSLKDSNAQGFLSVKKSFQMKPLSVNIQFKFGAASAQGPEFKKKKKGLTWGPL